MRDRVKNGTSGPGRADRWLFVAGIIGMVLLVVGTLLAATSAAHAARASAKASATSAKAATRADMARSIRYHPRLGAIDETITLVRDKAHVPVRADVACNFSWGIRGSETGRYHSPRIITRPDQKSFVRCGLKTLDGVTVRGSVYVWYVDERWSITKGPWHATTIAKKDRARGSAKPGTASTGLRCVRKVTSSTPGLTSYTVKVTNDPCHQPIRAAAYCYDKDWLIGIQWWKWYYGATLHGRGKSTADCTHWVQKWLNWGYQYKQRDSGKWIWHQLGSNPSAYRILSPITASLATESPIKTHFPRIVHICAETRNAECMQNGTHRKVYGRRLANNSAQKIHLEKIGTVSCSNQTPYAYPVRHFNCAEDGDVYYSLKNEATGKCLTYSNDTGNLNFDARCGIGHPITWFVLRGGSRFQSVAFSQIQDGDLELSALGLNKRVVLEVYLGQRDQSWAFYTNG